jgi:hypothetical protein
VAKVRVLVEKRGMDCRRGLVDEALGVQHLEHIDSLALTERTWWPSSRSSWALQRWPSPAVARAPRDAQSIAGRRHADLGSEFVGAGLRLREALHAHLVSSGAISAWSDTRSALLSALGGVLPADLSAAASSYLEEADVGESSGAARSRRLTFTIGERTVLLKLGSIASVKGQTHDATLVVQTTRSRVADVRLALEVAAGQTKSPTAKNPQRLKSATNIFVGSTRPRRLLCLALPEKDLSPKLRTAVEDWGWTVLPCPGHEA